MSILTRPILKISLENLAHNYRVLKNLTSARPAAVVKADAYGLGAEQVVTCLKKEGCDAFFVAHALEGIPLRSIVPEADIYVLQGVGEDCADLFKTYRLTPVIGSPQMLSFWNTLNIKSVKPVIQVETGLNRLGFRSQDIAEYLHNASDKFSYVLSHLSCADDIHHFMNDYQKDNFEKIKNDFHLPATLSASDGVFLGKAYHYDMVRLGATLYGLNCQQNENLKPVAMVLAPVLQVANVPKGQYIGYGATYQAEHDMKIAVVSIGYADGVKRCLSNKGFVKINGQKAPIVGRISMDNIMCDVTKLDGIHLGDMAFLLDDTYMADDMARDADTIGYEILTSFGQAKRLKKVYE